MSKQSYLVGFSKQASAAGINPEVLAKFCLQKQGQSVTGGVDYAAQNYGQNLGAHWAGKPNALDPSWFQSGIIGSLKNAWGGLSDDAKRSLIGSLGGAGIGATALTLAGDKKKKLRNFLLGLIGGGALGAGGSYLMNKSVKGRT